MEILYSIFIGIISSKIVGMIDGIGLQCRRDIGRRLGREKVQGVFVAAAETQVGFAPEPHSPKVAPQRRVGQRARVRDTPGLGCRRISRRPLGLDIRALLRGVERLSEAPSGLHLFRRHFKETTA